MAEELTLTGVRQMFYARLPDVKGTAGSVSFPLDEVLRASAAYRWTLNHTMICWGRMRTRRLLPRSSLFRGRSAGGG